MVEDMARVEPATWAGAEHGARADVLASAKPAADDTAGGVAPPEEESWAWHARELHDGVTQEIWYLQLELASLADRVPSNLPDLRGDIERLKKVAQDAYQEIRALLNPLYSRSLSDLNLVSELAELTQKFSEALGMEVQFRSSREVQKVPVSAKVGREIRRLVQEALWNSWRHSMCERASVTVKRSESRLIVIISDNGTGFSPETIDESHYGLRNMRERAEAIQGRLYVTSDIGKGTQVALLVPSDALR